MNARCSNQTELFRLSSYLEREQVSVKCNFGKLEPGLLVCQDKRCNITITTIENGHFRNRGKLVVTGEKINSGSNIQLKCSEGYELYNKTNSVYLKLEQTDIKCYQGSFPPEIPSCEPKRCFIEPPINQEYFIGQEKVLENYIHSGTVMNARCSNQTELFRLSSYLDKEQVSVRCNFGKLEPESLVCKDKRCNITITTIENGYFRSRGTVIVAGWKIHSGRIIQLLCSDGYELYNKTNSMYLELEHTDIKCYQGSFSPEIPSCEPKRCQVDRSLFLLPEVHYVEHDQNLTVHCPDKMELHLEENYQKLEEILMFCSKGIWTPKLPMCIKKMCKTSDLAREITDFIVSETKTTPGEFVSHNQSIEAVCGDGNRSHGVLTCNAGIWTGNSTCELAVTGCVLKDPRMHFISLGNRTVLKVGENANVSCKFGYQIVPNISAKRADQNDYPDSESTADPSEISETEDNGNLIAVSDGNYTCIDNGKWEPKIRFSCKQIICDSCNLENGLIFPPSHYAYTVGTVASFRCNSGYVRDGPETRTCQIDGTWSGECVTCQRITRNPSKICPAPCVPEGARKTGSHTYEIGSRVEFYCTRSKTQDIDDRRNIRHCIQNGEYASWNGTMINCKDPCSLSAVKGTIYRYTITRAQVPHGPIASGREIKVTCKDGFVPNKQHYDVSKCVNGVWTPEIVKCEKRGNASI